MDNQLYFSAATLLFIYSCYVTNPSFYQAVKSKAGMDTEQ